MFREEPELLPEEGHQAINLATSYQDKFSSVRNYREASVHSSTERQLRV